MAPPFVLHVWPGNWDLPSIEPSCLVAILYLQAAIPGKFALSTCTDPDLSPSGQLPYLTHELQVVSPLSSIIKYVSGIRPASLVGEGEAPAGGTPARAVIPDLDRQLGLVDKSKSIAWCAHVESHFGDLLAHVMYSLDANWTQLIGPTLASDLPVPQKYYVPGRIREAYKPRLEASDLWNLPGVEQEEKTKFGEKKPEEKKEHKFKRVFEREKVAERAKECFDIYSRLLGDKQYFYLDRPTTLDVFLASYVLLLIDPPYPDSLLQTLLLGSYPALTLHARRVYNRVFPDINSFPKTLPPQTHSLTALFPSLPSFGLSFGGKKKQTSEEEKEFTRYRWGWIGLAVVGAVVSWAMLGPRFVIVVSTPDNDEEEGEAEFEEKEEFVPPHLDGDEEEEEER
ncbi:hypothetical protein JAAARDRAFT_173425 [Jaapia argillacea MUCL 33604]|uniref:Mitochondrial outer membrane transport complex Sam37/metaxin N-terminal domain-containing protein n=1 Tax=Jaapia argillacea MUCL 33604 TaxID=933084 RepID=A0A067Q4C6_9AGAM|nr:hypothetical protein JAAARDRAFT_173425 [Jaapia argillacea MUCL 33604]